MKANWNTLEALRRLEILLNNRLGTNDIFVSFEKINGLTPGRQFILRVVGEIYPVHNIALLKVIKEDQGLGDEYDWDIISCICRKCVDYLPVGKCAILEQKPEIAEKTCWRKGVDVSRTLF